MVATRILLVALVATVPASTDAACIECFPTACPLDDGTQKACTDAEPYYDFDSDICSSDCTEDWVDYGGDDPADDGSTSPSCDMMCFPTACTLDDGTEKACTDYNPYYDADQDLCTNTCTAELLVERKMHPLVAAGIGAVAGVFAVTAAFRIMKSSRKSSIEEGLLVA
eukprot:gnl/TRDRNA2_/TRDRNA2_176561_c0_seq3.p1 gnl/TRDRNA2_/TRDRNA2_176561_c0~~gnl/TRDRNA2_/TRDRNA2_176561_c0_seq3.p1  ORF type:complete len:184 (+),score=34.14 gnl/TRDRNA2_/TRDRNA2_176561_c0_seq3:49-552(+)